MSVSTKMAVAVIGGLLFAAAYAPAWAQSVDAKAPAAQAASGLTGGQYILGVVTPLLNATTRHEAQKNCKADSLYSAHDVVGDPESCFVSRVDVRASSINAGAGGIGF
jgi:hypothetical protein